MTHRWWRRNAVALAAAPVVLGTGFWVAGRPLIDLWSESDAPVGSAAIGQPFSWDTGTFELSTVRLVPSPFDDDGDPFDPPTGTVVWRTAWRASGPDADTGLGCVVELVDADGRRFGANPAELNRLGNRASCTPTDETDADRYHFVHYFLLPAGVEPVAVRFGSLLHETVEIRLA
jgi:hypothetical protein